MHRNNNELKLKEENLKKIKRKIVVLSGKGGVGKSTVSVNLSYAFALQGKTTGILDVDFHGPSLAKMTGSEGLRLMVEKEGDRPKPLEVVKNLYLLSTALLLDNPDEPVIWRGPLKIGAIQQFFEDIEWPYLDYLVVDCPPGTGDEPLSVIQTIGDVTGVVIVSTPQDIAFLDVRKSINFVKKLDIPIFGIIENMSGFVCPECGKNIDIFKSGGAEKVAKDFNLEILGKIPIDPDIVNSCDEGKPYVYFYNKADGAKIFVKIAEKIEKIIDGA